MIDSSLGCHDEQPLLCYLLCSCVFEMMSSSMDVLIARGKDSKDHWTVFVGMVGRLVPRGIRQGTYIGIITYPR